MKTKPVTSTLISAHTMKKTLLFSALLLSNNALADDVHFSFNAAGETKSMTHWGVDTAWPSADNVRQTVYHMGIEETDIIRLNFFTDEPLDANGELGPNSKAQIDYQLQLRATYAPDKPIALLPATESGTHSSYIDANGEANPQKWLAVMEATAAYIGEPIHSLEVYNEPDYWAGMGSPETLLQTMLLTQQSPYFQNTELHAASTLCSCTALEWYDVVKGPTTHGSLHQLASWWNNASDNYINFIEYVKSQGDIPYNDELHSMPEVLQGAEYGMAGGIWWGAVTRVRGVLVNAVQGKRLGYKENRLNDSTAAVYRAPDGEVYGFAGSYERYGAKHSYRFIADDQDVYFNGIGPLREYMMPTWAGPEGGYFDIDDAPTMPALDGHKWKVVNRASGEVLEVVSAGTAEGDNISTATDNNASSQKWNIIRSKEGYIAMFNANSGITAEVANWSLEAGANVQQWGSASGFNQWWWIKPTGDGYFYIHNGHSNLVLEDDAASDNAIQSDFDGEMTQQWSFELADEPGSLVAHYPFDGSTSDETGSHNASAVGAPGYWNHSAGQSLILDGSDDYIDLPTDITNLENITIATWLYWDGISNLERVFDFGMVNTSGDPERYMMLTPRNSDGLMEFAITTAGYQEEETLVTSALPVGEWVHLAVTMSGNTAMLYINGELQVAGQIFTNPSDLFGTGQQNNYIGKSQWQWDPLFKGSIDEFRVYDYALNSAEVAALATQETSGNALEFIDDSFENGFNANWIEFDTWETSNRAYVSGSVSAHADANSNDLVTKAINASTANSVYIQFWYQEDKIDDNDDVFVQLFNGTDWINLVELGNAPEKSWNFYSTTVSDPQYMISDFKLRIVGASIDGGEHLYLDDVVIMPQ